MKLRGCAIYQMCTLRKLIVMAKRSWRLDLSINCKAAIG